MKFRLKKHIFFILFIGFCLLGGHQIVHAEGEPYTIDQAPLNPPDISDYTVTPVSTLAELSNGLNDENQTKVIYQLENDLQLTARTPIVGDKAINLNGHTLSATSDGYLTVSTYNACNEFKLYNGHLSGGPESKATGLYNWYGNGFMHFNYQALVDVTFEDIDYVSPENGGSMFIGLSANVFCLGKVNVKTYATNIRAANMTFLGDFNGEAYGQGNPDFLAEGNGGVNLSFDGYEWGLRNPFSQKAASGADLAPMSQTVGDRRLYIAPNSHVVLNNTNASTNGIFPLAYGNNIANFSTLNVDGSLIATAVGSSLRTTASGVSPFGFSKPPKGGYLNQAGTYNALANINVNEGAIFEISSTDTNGKYGALFTYSTNVNSYKPKIFDMRYFGTGLFFWSWNDLPHSNMYLYDLNIGVWDKDLKGIGDPTLSWENVASLSVEGFQTNAFGNSQPGTVSSSNPDLQRSFSIANYSRISNDIAIPKTVVDSQFINVDGDVFLNNGGDTFSGSTVYIEPSGVVPNEVAVGATVTLKIDNLVYTTKTDEEGKWSFTNLDLSKIKGGTVGTLNLTDTDLRVAPEVKVNIKDTIPPVATPKIQLVKLGDTTALQNAKECIASTSDETSPSNKLTYEFVTPEEERQEMISRLGVYTVDVIVSDEAGNKTIVDTPVIVYPPGQTITTGYVVGNDFNIDYDSWNNASDEEKRTLMIEKGLVKGYDIDLKNNTITDVTDDPTKMIVNFSKTTWEPNKTYPVTVKVNNYSKIIQVTLVPDTVGMTIKQVYENTDDPIYSDLEDKTPVNNERSVDVLAGSSIEDMLNNQISNGSLTLNYDGYSSQSISDYKVYQNNTLVTPTPTEVPNGDFTVEYSYQGQLKFQNVAKKLDFGSVAITANTSDTPLSDSSDQSISIINTIQNTSWKLKAALPEGIRESDNKLFVGTIMYRGENGTNQMLNNNPTEIDKQTGGSLYSQLSLKNNNSGLYLHQDAGNLKGTYTGKLVWTLEDTP